MIMHFFKKIQNKISASYLLFLTLIILVGIAAFYFGYENGRNYPKIITVENICNIENNQSTQANFGIFWEAWDMLKKEHLKGAQAVDKDLVYGAIDGLVNSLGDPNTVFFPPEDSKKFEEDVNGSFGGIGAEIGTKNNQLVVIAPLEGTPAEKAGLKAGDKILAIDGKSAEKLDVNEAVKKIRGEVGKEVILLILRETWTAPKEIKITRAVIEIPTLKWNYIAKDSKGIAGEESKAIIEKSGKKIAHLQLYSFNQNAPVVFYKAALMILFGNIDGIILDLRNNPGGYLEIANNLAGWFLDKGDIIVKEKFRNGTEDVFRANGNSALKKIPTVILVNKGSASASEILAGALRAHLKTKLIGTNTFGKGTVQELKSLSDNSKIKLTIANWELPDGSIISEEGIKPDIEINISEEDVKNNHDTQLEKGIEVLISEMQSQKIVSP